MQPSHPTPEEQPEEDGPDGEVDPSLDGHWRGARDAMEQAGLDLGTVWMRYFGMTGVAGEYEVDAYLNGSLPLPDIQADLLAHAINELIDELPPRLRAPYSDQPPRPDKPQRDC